MDTVTENGAWSNKTGSVELMPGSLSYIVPGNLIYHSPAGQTNGNRYGTASVSTNTTKFQLLFACGTETQVTNNNARYIWANAQADILLGAGTRTHTIYPDDWPDDNERIALRSDANYATTEDNGTNFGTIYNIYNPSPGPSYVILDAEKFVYVPNSNVVKWTGSRPTEIRIQQTTGANAGQVFSYPLTRWVEEDETVVEAVTQYSRKTGPTVFTFRVEKWGRFRTDWAVVGEVINGEPIVDLPFSLTTDRYELFWMEDSPFFNPGQFLTVPKTSQQTLANPRIPYGFFGISFTFFGDAVFSEFIPNPLSQRLKMVPEFQALGPSGPPAEYIPGQTGNYPGVDTGTTINGGPIYAGVNFSADFSSSGE